MICSLDFSSLFHSDEMYSCAFAEELCYEILVDTHDNDAQMRKVVAMTIHFQYDCPEMMA